MEETRIIEAKAENTLAYLKRVWDFRNLILTMARRDLKAQYAQTILGLFWSVIQPLTGLLVFTLFFDLMIDVGDKIDYPYPLFAFSGMLSWYYFTYLIAHAGTAVQNSRDLINKIYFPKLVLPLSKVIVGGVEFLISLGLLVLLMLFEGHLPNWQIVFLPFFVILNIIVGLSIGIWMSALTVRFRDFHHIIPYLVNFGIWLTPVFYPSTLFPEKLKFLIYINPMAGVIAGFRWTILGDTQPSPYFLISFIASIVLLISGLFFFREVEKTIADLI